MTDGIIQEVFNRYSVALVKTSMDKRTYDLLEKELIEKIKQEFALSYEFNNDITIIKTLRIKLIGDNQE